MQIANAKQACNLVGWIWDPGEADGSFGCDTTVVGSWAVQQESGDRYGFDTGIPVWGQDENVEQIIG